MARPHSAKSLIAWRPNSALDQSALARLERFGPKPRAPMGEAWFLGPSRVTFGELSGDLERLPTHFIQIALKEIASGVSSFGPREEWVGWYQYLLPRLLPLSHHRFAFCYTLELLNTCFLALFPDESAELGAYPRFREDAMCTLGLSMMSPPRWEGDRICLGAALHACGVSPRNGYPMFHDVCGDLSSSLFLCLKYLRPGELDAWLRSILAIDDPHWRCQLLVWFSEAGALLRGEHQFLSELEDGSRISWAWSHALDGRYTDDREQATRFPYLAAWSSTEKFEIIKRRLRRIRLDEWLEEASAIDYLREVADAAAAPPFSHTYL